MDIIELIRKIVLGIENSSKLFNISYTKEVDNIINKTKGDFSKTKKLLLGNTKIEKAINLYLVDINKTSLELMENMIDSYAKKYNIAKGRILFATDIKTINSTMIKGLSSNIEQAIFSNILAIQFTSDRDALATIISNQINKNIMTTKNLLEEALTTTSRNISDLIHINIEKNLRKRGDLTPIYYKYAGVKDSRNAPICAKNVGQIDTRAGWKSKGINAVDMGHRGCRHAMEIATQEEVKDLLGNQDA